MESSGDHVLLGTSTAGVTTPKVITTENINNFKELSLFHFVSAGSTSGNTTCSNVRIPVFLYKTVSNVQARWVDNGQYRFASLNYVSDTQLKLAVNGSGLAVLYGVR